MSIQEKVKVASKFTLRSQKLDRHPTTHFSFPFYHHHSTYHLFGLGDLKDVADVERGVDWNWPWPWQIVHPRAVALIDTFQLLVVF